MRRDIIRCRLAPGQEVSEAQLAERYNVGKTPIREGLARLAHERFVQPLPRIGYRVSPITLSDTKELLVFRRIVESEAARLAAGSCNITQLRRLDGLCELPHEPKDSKNVERLLRANVDFHTAVAAASRNAKLTAAVVQVLDEIARVL
jgi:DNA-binding GntR family transcriptional regulator